MRGLLLEELERGYFTNMKEIFGAMSGYQKDYNWLITDYECNCYPSKEISENGKYAFLDGKQLTKIIENNEIQFIWGVFTGFKKEYKLEEILTEPLPYADGNAQLWSKNIKIQNSLADIEIISWDSSLLMVLAKEGRVIENFAEKFPKCRDLAEYNSNNH